MVNAENGHMNIYVRVEKKTNAHRVYAGFDLLN